MTKEEIQALISEALGNAGYLTKTEFGATAAMIRGMKDSLTSLTSTSPMDALVTAGLLERNPDGTFKAKAQAAPGQKKEGQEPEWQIELKKMQDQIAAKDRQLEAEKKTREDIELKSAVISAFEKAGAVNAQRDFVHVIGQVKRGEDGKYFVPKVNQYGAEDAVPLETAFGDFLKGAPELKKAGVTTGGSGTPHAASQATATEVTGNYAAHRRAVLAGDVKVQF